MPLLPVPREQRIWQFLAEFYKPPNNPWAAFAPDRKMGAFHMGTLAINFEPGTVNQMSLHNPWAIDLWPTAYPLRVPDEWAMTDFPDGYDPSWVAYVIGYSLNLGVEDPITTPGVIGPDGRTPPSNEGELPAWVAAYVAWLQQQLDRYGEIRVRQLRPEHP